MEFISLTIASIILTLKSMYSLMPERSEGTLNQNAQTIPETSPQPHLLLNNADIANVLQATCIFLKQNPNYTVTIEKIVTSRESPEYLLIAHPLFIEYLTQYIQITPISEVWTNEWQNNYIVTNASDMTDHPVAIQYTLSHKYEQIYYITNQAVVLKPAEYDINGIDAFKWSQFLMRQHVAENTIITEEKLITSIKGD